MDKNNVIELECRVIGTDPLTELLKEGARKLLARAVESKGRPTGKLSVGAGATVHSQNAFTGSGRTLAVFEGRFQRRNERCVAGSDWPPGQGLIGQHGIAPETGLGG